MDEAVGYDVLIVGSGFGGSLAALRLKRERLPGGGYAPPCPYGVQ